MDTLVMDIFMLLLTTSYLEYLNDIFYIFLTMICFSVTVLLILIFLLFLCVFYQLPYQEKHLISFFLIFFYRELISKYWSIEFFNDQLWGYEILFEWVLGVWNFVGMSYGGMKFCTHFRKLFQNSFEDSMYSYTVKTRFVHIDSRKDSIYSINQHSHFSHLDFGHFWAISFLKFWCPTWVDWSPTPDPI